MRNYKYKFNILSITKRNFFFFCFRTAPHSTKPPAVEVVVVVVIVVVVVGVVVVVVVVGVENLVFLGEFGAGHVSENGKSWKKGGEGGWGCRKPGSHATTKTKKRKPR